MPLATESTKHQQPQHAVVWYHSMLQWPDFSMWLQRERWCAGCTHGNFLATSDSYPCFRVDSTPRMGEWVDGWDGEFGMISPHGLAPFRLGIWTGLLLDGKMDWPVSSWEYGLAPLWLGISTGPFPSAIVPHFPPILMCLPDLLDRELMFCFRFWMKHTPPLGSGAFMLRSKDCSEFAWR